MKLVQEGIHFEPRIQKNSVPGILIVFVNFNEKVFLPLECIVDDFNYAKDVLIEDLSSKKEQELIRINKLKESALSKLTEDEISALGLNNKKA